MENNQGYDYEAQCIGTASLEDMLAAESEVESDVSEFWQDIAEGIYKESESSDAATSDDSVNTQLNHLF